MPDRTRLQFWGRFAAQREQAPSPQVVTCLKCATTLHPSQSSPNKRGWRDMPAHWPGSQPWIDCPVSGAGTDFTHQRRHGVPHEESTMSSIIAGIKIPDSALAKATTEYIRDVESDLLYHHSRRVFLFGALSGERKQLAYNPELLYVGAMFHDLGLVEGHRSDNERFEVDGANAAAAFLKPYGLSDDDIEQVAVHRPAYHAGRAAASAPDRGAGNRRCRDGRAGHGLRRVFQRAARSRGACASTW